MTDFLCIILVQNISLLPALFLVKDGKWLLHGKTLPKHLNTSSFFHYLAVATHHRKSGWCCSWTEGWQVGHAAAESPFPAAAAAASSSQAPLLAITNCLCPLVWKAAAQLDPVASLDASFSLGLPWGSYLQKKESAIATVCGGELILGCC